MHLNKKYRFGVIGFVTCISYFYFLNLNKPKEKNVYSSVDRELKCTENWSGFLLFEIKLDPVISRTCNPVSYPIYREENGLYQI